MKTSVHRAPDGTELRTYEWSPDGEPRASLQIIHGMAEHARRYAHVAEAFNARGYVVRAHDHRGHGQSVKSAAQLGDMGDWAAVVRDAHRINQELHRDHPSLPVVVFGHSMGSFMTQQLLYEHPEDASAWVLSGTNGKPPAIAALGRVVTRLERLRRGPHRSSALLTKLSFGDFNKPFEGRTEYDWLSRDEAQVDAYVADPLCGFEVSTDTWVGLLDALGIIAAPSNQARIPKDTPIYLMAGGEDPVGDRGAGVRRLSDAYAKAGLTDVTTEIYSGARHELVNETNRDAVIETLLDWCDAALERHGGA